MAQEPKPLKTTRASGPAGAPELSSDLLEQLANHTAANREHDKAVEAQSEPKKVPSTFAPKAPQTSTSTNKETDDDDGYSTPENDAAVDDIVRTEGDQLLAQADAVKQPKPVQKSGFWHAVAQFFYRWWHNAWARWVTIFILSIAIAVTAAVPSSRYAVLNFFGVRASVTIVVYDSSTRLPLKNIDVYADNHHDTTSVNGAAKVQHVRLGKQTVQIKRFGYKTVTQNIVVGWGSNPIGTFYLVATGAQYALTVNDYVSGLGIVGVEADSGQASALSDKKGIITLTLDDNAVDADVTIHAEDYRSEKLHIDLTKATAGTIMLVPSTKALYVAKQDNVYNLISSDVDGKNQAVLLTGTGRETADIALAVSPDHSHAALVSTRDNVHDRDGYLLSTLSVVSMSGGKQTVAHAEQLKLVDWIGTKLIFQQATAGASVSNSQRYKLISYDYATNTQVQLANANQFNSVLSAQSQIYYAVSSTDPAVHAAFWRVKPDGSARQNLMNTEAWSAFRADYNAIQLQTPSGWFTYAINGSSTPQSSSQPTSFANRFYLPNSSTQNIWVDTQTNPNSLNAYDVATGKNKQVIARDGLSSPVYWLNEQTAVFRLATSQQTADYAVSIANGHTKKIADVISTSGLAPTN